MEGSQPITNIMGTTKHFFFAGDNVRLAGQIDYPDRMPTTDSGYPLIFIIQHATSNTREGYAHIARLGNDLGIAVMRWDKRGTGNSGAGGSGSIQIDTLGAYETAITQPHIDREKVIIFAQNEGTLLIAEAYQEFENLHHPLGIILSGNMVDETLITRFDTQLHIVTSKNDWNAWQIYAETVSKAHTHKYANKYPETQFYVAPNTNRRLMYDNGGTFHRGAATSIQDWLIHVCELDV